MLIIKEPIKLKSLSPIVSRSDGFCERMNANYQVLWAKYNPEDLFHLISQPPEVYVGEGSMTTVVTQNLNQMNQEVRFEMVHNLINRLMMADSPRFTYQDMVFVQSMLQKLGVKNVSEFMEQLYEMREDTQNIRQLQELYETNMTVLGRAFADAGRQQGITEPQDVQIQKEKETLIYRLHQEIFDRLKSEEVYHFAAVFQRDAVHQYHQIRSQETKMAEQMRTLLVLRLHRLKDEALPGNSLLLDHRVNLYEEGAVDDSFREDGILNELAGAVLLNLSDNLYLLRADEIKEGQVPWFRFQGDLSQIFKNTLNRFQTGHLTIHSKRRQETYRFLQRSVQAFRRQEIRQLRKVLEEEKIPKEYMKDVIEGIQKELGWQTGRFLEYNLYSEQGVRRILQDVREELKKRQEEERTVVNDLEELTRQRELIEQNILKPDGENLLEHRHIADANDDVLRLEQEIQEMAGHRGHRLTGAEELQAMSEINQASKRLERRLDERLMELPDEAERVSILEDEVRRLNEENRQKMEEDRERRLKRDAEDMKAPGRKIRPEASLTRIDRKRTREETLLLLENPESADRYFYEKEEGLSRASNEEKDSNRDRVSRKEKSPDEEKVLKEREALKEEKVLKEGEVLKEEKVLKEREVLNERDVLNEEIFSGQTPGRETQNILKEITVRLSAGEEKRVGISKEIQRLERLMEPLEEIVRGQILADEAGRKRADLWHQQGDSIYEEIQTELKNFIGCLEAERQAEETREGSRGLFRIQDALAGKTEQKINAEDSKVTAKRLIVLRDSLTEIERQLNAGQIRGKEVHLEKEGKPVRTVLTELQDEQFETNESKHQTDRPGMQTERTERQTEQLLQWTDHQVKQIEQQAAQQEKQAEQQVRQTGQWKKQAEQQVRQTGQWKKQAEQQMKQAELQTQESEHQIKRQIKQTEQQIERQTQQIKQTEQQIKQTAGHETEIRKNYVRILRQISRIVENCQVKEEDQTKAGQIRQAKEQKKTLLELLHRSENFILQEEDMKPKGRPGKHSRAVHSYLELLQNYWNPKNRWKEADNPEFRHIYQEFWNVHREFGDIHREPLQVFMESSKEVRTVQMEHMRTRLRRFREDEEQRVVRGSQISRRENVSFYHKQTEFIDQETVIEEIRNSAASKRNAGTVHEIIHTDGQIKAQTGLIKQQIQVQSDNLVKQNTGNINDMIQRGVQRQIDSISNQVYRRLERKLSDDRRRRGY